MTQARTASYGVVTPPPLQHWLNAVLMLFIELVQRVAATLGMWRRVGKRDWHTQSDVSALPQAKSDTNLKKESNTTHGVILGLVPRISVGASRGLTTIPLETNNRDSRHKTENDSAHAAATVLEAHLLVRVPREGGDPVLRAAQTHTHPSALKRADQTAACAVDAVDGAVRVAA